MRLLTLAILLLLCSDSFGQDKTKIAVMDLKAKGVEKTTASILSDKVRTELFKAGNYSVLNREDMKAILGEHLFQQGGLCDDTKCMAKIGGALGVVYMITGSIGKLGKTYNITLKIIDIEKIENINIIDEVYKGADDGLFDAVINACNKLLESNRVSMNEEIDTSQQKKDVVIKTQRKAIPRKLDMNNWGIGLKFGPAIFGPEIRYNIDNKSQVSISGFYLTWTSNDLEMSSLDTEFGYRYYFDKIHIGANLNITTMKMVEDNSSSSSQSVILSLMPGYEFGGRSGWFFDGAIGYNLSLRSFELEASTGETHYGGFSGFSFYIACGYYLF